MNIKYDEFIGIYDNVYPEGYCEHLIEEFERLSALGAGCDRRGEGAKAHQKNDYSISLNIRNHGGLKPFEDKCIVDIFFDGLQGCFRNYGDTFSILQEHSLHTTDMKVQRTSPGGGYHVWHAEHCGLAEQVNRVLVFILYLNTLETQHCGETEFLYQQKRYNPTKNRMILWPAAFTHTHRGNPVYGDVNKYIITGWFYFK